MDEKSVKCPRCKCFRYPSDFLKESRQLKTCIKCRENSAKFRSINLCSHNKQKYNCKECNGCPHDKLKYHCKDCGGAVVICVYTESEKTSVRNVVKDLFVNMDDVNTFVKSVVILSK